MTKCTFYLFYLVFVDRFEYMAWCISSVLENSQALFLLILALSICSLPSFCSKYMYVKFSHCILSISYALYFYTFGALFLILIFFFYISFTSLILISLLSNLLLNLSIEFFISDLYFSVTELPFISFTSFY